MSIVDSIDSRKKDAKSIGKLRELVALCDQIHRKIENERRKQIDLEYQACVFSLVLYNFKCRCVIGMENLESYLK